MALKFGYWMPLGSGGFVISNIEQRTDWSLDYNAKLAQTAEDVLRKYFATYRGLDNYLREAANRAVQQRQTRTASGRLVRFRFDEADRQQISMTQRNGKNTPVQGTSADILKRALRLLEDQLRETSAKIVNIIHDEIVVEVDAGEANAVAQMVERLMCAAGEEYLQTVPVKVETEIADEWVK